MNILFRTLILTAVLFLNFQLSFAMGQFGMTEDKWVGKVVPEFTLKTFKGETMSLSQMRAGQPAIIFFWATWCPHCREQLRHLSEQAETFAAKGIKIILVDVGEELAPVQAYVAKNKIVFDIFMDMESKVSEQYEIIGVPTFYFVNKAGVVRSVDHGLPDDVEAILNK